MRRMILVTTLIALILMPAHSATADDEAVRSGTIVTGYWGNVLGEPGTCDTAPDCRVWVDGGCDAALAGRDPAVMSSIEDVADLADGRTPWTFAFEPGWSESQGAAVIQFWQGGCGEIAESRWSSETCRCRSGVVRIPESAKWMTVTGVQAHPPWGIAMLDDPEPMTIDWSLTREEGQPSRPSPAPAPSGSPTPPPSPASEPTAVERSVGLSLRGHLRAFGKVVSNEDACTVDVPIIIQRKGSTGWIEMGSTSTGTGGAFTIRLNDRAGRYRAVAPEVRYEEGSVCLETESTPRQHRH